MFGAAKALKHIAQSAINPAMWDDNLKHLLPKQPRIGSLRGKHKSLPYDEIPAFMAELRADATERQDAGGLHPQLRAHHRSHSDAVVATRSETRARWVIPGKIMENELQADILLTATVLARVLLA